MKKVFLILLIIVLCGCGYDEYKMPEDVYIDSNDNNFEIYSINVVAKNLIKKSNVTIINKNSKLETDKLGKHKFTIKYKYKKRNYKYDMTYNVVDTTKPIILSASTTRTILLGDQVDFCEDINFADNYDRNLKCSIEGDYDPYTRGKYNLKYVITDSSENKEEKDFTTYVVDKITSSSNNSSNNKHSNILFSDVKKKYKNDKNMIGIDVSRWQQDIDFKKVKEAGCEFVIIRFGINSDIDKDISVDTYYKQNIKSAKDAGLKVGIYVYTSAINEKTALEHAKWVIKNLDNEKLDFPIAFDWENWDKFRSYGINMHDLTNSYLVFEKELNKKGYSTMLYSSAYYLKNIWMYNDDYDVWLAHYTDKTDYEGKYIMWQMTNIGKIDGINGDVDIDIYNKK